MEKDCYNCRFEHYLADEIPCIHCGIDGREYWQPKAKTNADRIRDMTDEELAVYLCKMMPLCTSASCPGEHLCNGMDGQANGLKKWLKQPAEGDA